MEEKDLYKALHAMLGVCRVWNGSVASNLKYLRLNFTLDLGAVGRTFRSLETLDLRQMTVGGALNGISNFSNLKSLYLNGRLRGNFETNRDDIVVQVLPPSCPRTFVATCALCRAHSNIEVCIISMQYVNKLCWACWINRLSTL